MPFVGAGEDRYIGGVAEKYGFPLDLPAAKRRTYEIYLDLVPLKLQPFPGVHDLIHACREAGLRLAVASSADAIKVMANLKKIELPPDTWDVVLTGESVTRNKPAPDIFLLAAQKLGVNPVRMCGRRRCRQRRTGRQSRRDAVRGRGAHVSGWNGCTRLIWCERISRKCV